MKIRFRKVLSFLFVLCLLMNTMSGVYVTATPDVDTQYYGEAYYDLKTEDHKLAYRLLEEGIAGLAPRIEFEGIVKINYKQMCDVIRAVCVDHPQYFWFLEEGGFTYGDVSHGGYIVSFDPKYILDGKEVAVGSQALSDAMFAFHNKVQQIIQSIPVNYTTEYEIALYLHDYLAQQVTYTLEGEHPSAYAALIHGEAACYGYSKAYQCLLNAAGIRARTITGTSDNGDGKLEGHAWNQVWIDDECYYVDVTWDDQNVVTMHSYFLIPLSDISKDHFAGSEFILPECNHKEIDITAAGKGIAYADYTTSAKQVAPSFYPISKTENAVTLVCEIKYDGNNFFDWLDWIGMDLLNELGLSRTTSVYYYDLYDSYYLQLVDNHYNAKKSEVIAILLEETQIILSGTGRQYQLQPQIQAESVWTPDVIYSSSDDAVVKVSESGLITANGPGTAVITVTNEDATVQASCTITVEEAPAHTHTMRLFSEKQPTCVQDGYQTHYLCIGCGIRFNDEFGSAALLKTTDFIYPATGHQQYSWVKKLDFHVEKCACGYEKPNTTGNHIDKDSNGKCDVCDGVIPKGDSSVQTKPEPSGKEQAAANWLIPTVIVVILVVGIIVFLLIRKRRRDNAIKPFGG